MAEQSGTIQFGLLQRTPMTNVVMAHAIVPVTEKIWLQGIAVDRLITQANSPEGGMNESLPFAEAEARAEQTFYTCVGCASQPACKGDVRVSIGCLGIYITLFANRKFAGDPSICAQRIYVKPKNPK